MVQQPQMCSLCRQPGTQFLGSIPFRTGGSSGAVLFFFNSIAEMDERLLELEIFRCNACGHLDFFDFDRSLPRK